MTRDEAMLLILREWYALPGSERETEHHAAVFAMKIQNKYSFRSSGDKQARLFLAALDAVKERQLPG
jgi:hypothetical protein